jgi:SAM-dependent methyltransferase
VTDDVREEVRVHYAAAAKAAAAGTDACCGPAGCLCGPSEDGFGSGLYDPEQLEQVPDAAVLASLGCGNPHAVAELREGETVLDLGSGGGIDVLLSARRVGPSGFAYGLDMTDEMLELARENAERAGVSNVRFLQGYIEEVPLGDGSVDVVISNCVINLSADKGRVLREMFRVLRPGGRVGVSDVVSSDDLGPAERAARGSLVGCIAGALSISEYREGLEAAGFVDVAIEPTHEVVDGMYSAIVRAIRP